ncbi:PQQ-binding-like beta-propeller repeat protein [Thermomonas sp.]|uniref:outer membrane protein assembly factor BamB family protein n=1 Tax=Thermomonas sp. TaxID=1971895 RepID=UPI00248A8060|nr:PQQ-binding-like beta-propeller repeat protein [Thermomonas sp.]MDI1253661.1 PQQ-binding-like beta-propeller repeat protein [Thermomonas sp.]
MKKVWESHTRDLSDGSGNVPATVWSATPISANNTLYIGTPFYRLIALDPATGKQKWSFDTHTPLKALTQPVLKNRGVAFWATDDPVTRMPCQKIVYMGTMDARLFALDADTGKKCAGFANDGVLNVNQWNTTHDKWPLSLLQPPTVVGDHLISARPARIGLSRRPPAPCGQSMHVPESANGPSKRCPMRCARRAVPPTSVPRCRPTENLVSCICLSRPHHPTTGVATGQKQHHWRRLLPHWTSRLAGLSGRGNGCITTSWITTSTRRRH